MFNINNNINQEINLLRVCLLLAFALVSACGGGGDEPVNNPVDEVSKLFPDCTSGNAEFSGCWVSETCDFDQSTPGVSSLTIFRYQEITFDPVVSGQAEVYGVVYENETCSGTPSLVSNVGFLESYTQKDDVACADTDGTDLSPGCTNIELIVIHEDGTPVSGLLPEDEHFYMTNGTRLCKTDENSNDDINLTSDACYLKFTS